MEERGKLPSHREMARLYDSAKRYNFRWSDDLVHLSSVIPDHKFNDIDDDYLVFKSHVPKILDQFDQIMHALYRAGYRDDDLRCSFNLVYADYFGRLEVRTIVSDRHICYFNKDGCFIVSPEEFYKFK